MKKIDMFTHIWPQPFYKALCKHVGERTDITMRKRAEDAFREAHQELELRV